MGSVNGIERWWSPREVLPRGAARAEEGFRDRAQELRDPLDDTLLRRVLRGDLLVRIRERRGGGGGRGGRHSLDSHRVLRDAGVGADVRTRAIRGHLEGSAAGARAPAGNLSRQTAGYRGAAVRHRVDRG